MNTDVHVQFPHWGFPSTNTTIMYSLNKSITDPNVLTNLHGIVDASNSWGVYSVCVGQTNKADVKVQYFANAFERNNGSSCSNIL